MHEKGMRPSVDAGLEDTPATLADHGVPFGACGCEEEESL
jgi:hypothetical protein